METGKKPQLDPKPAGERLYLIEPGLGLEPWDLPGKLESVPG